jgi:hypothetical protein
MELGQLHPAVFLTDRLQLMRLQPRGAVTENCHIEPFVESRYMETRNPTHPLNPLPYEVSQGTVTPQDFPDQTPFGLFIGRRKNLVATKYSVYRRLKLTQIVDTVRDPGYPGAGSGPAGRPHTGILQGRAHIPVRDPRKICIAPTLDFDHPEHVIRQWRRQLFRDLSFQAPAT